MRLKTESLYRDIDNRIVWHCDVVGETLEDCGGIRFARTSASSPEEAKKRANLIVKACNSHSPLIDACKGLMNVWNQVCGQFNDLELQDDGFNGSTDYIGRARQAINKAEGGTN